ncbi:FUSC family protein [Kaistia soli]|uniref:FUSC family protein n=1 Tax=Kaistia soli TaxID=446684 RepID=UPI00158804E7|nr:FUSC family protein [Kaistia soli]
MSARETIRSALGGAMRLGFDRETMERSIRFTLTVMAPIVVTLVTGPENWLVYAMVSAIVAFAGDAGGPPLARFGWMAIGPLALSAGLALGALAAGHLGFVFALSMGAGLAYGLVETAHPHLLLATRFFAFGVVLAGLVSAPVPVDYLAVLVMLVISWLISLAGDLHDGQWHPLSVPPAASIGLSLKGPAGPRIAFAIAVMLSIGAALLAAQLLGSLRPSWTCLTVLLVMRSEVVSSLRLAVERVIGTLGGVVVAVLIADLGNHRLTLFAMALAAFVRWPAQQFHNALGVFCLTLFVLLMVEIVSPDRQTTALLLHERLTDTVIGAIAAGLGLLAFNRLQRWIGPIAQRSRPPRQEA